MAKSQIIRAREELRSQVLRIVDRESLSVSDALLRLIDLVRRDGIWRYLAKHRCLKSHSSFGLESQDESLRNQRRDEERNRWARLLDLINAEEKSSAGCSEMASERRGRYYFYLGLLLFLGYKWVFPLMRLVAEIEDQARTRGLTAFTSHERLIISIHPAYPEWFQDESIRLYPQSCTFINVLPYEEEPENLFAGIPEPACAIPFELEFVDGKCCRHGFLVPYDKLIESLVPFLDKLAKKRGHVYGKFDMESTSVPVPQPLR